MCKRSNALSRPVLMVRGLDGYFHSRSFARPTVQFSSSGGGLVSHLSVVIARGPHLFPFRTEQLSPSAPMVLGLAGPGRVGRRRFTSRAAPRGGPSSFRQSCPRLPPRHVRVLANHPDRRSSCCCSCSSSAAWSPCARARRAARRARSSGMSRAADQALEQARAADRGWDRDTMEATARAAIESARPGWRLRRLHLVLVDDRPGIEEDRAHFMAVGPDGAGAAWSWRARATPGSPRGSSSARRRARGSSTLGFVPSDLERAVPRRAAPGLCWGSPGAAPRGLRGAPRGRPAARRSTLGRDRQGGARPRFMALVHDAFKV